MFALVALVHVTMASQLAALREDVELQKTKLDDAVSALEDMDYYYGKLKRTSPKSRKISKYTALYEAGDKQRDTHCKNAVKALEKLVMFAKAIDVHKKDIAAQCEKLDWARRDNAHWHKKQ